MSHIRGMQVYLSTHDDADSGTDDQLYVGVWGTDSGREFPLASAAIDDFETSTTVSYLLGDVPDDAVLSGAVRADRSTPGAANDPEPLDIELNSVQHVYLKKAAYGSGAGDDNAYKLRYVWVGLYGLRQTPDRTFYLAPPAEGLWFGNEHGHQAWLKPLS